MSRLKVIPYEEKELRYRIDKKLIKALPEPIVSVLFPNYHYYKTRRKNY